MTTHVTSEPKLRKPIRLWPGVVAAVLLILIRFGLPLVVPDAKMGAVLGSLALSLVILLWWLFFSRAPWSERLLMLVLMTIALFATARIVDPSIRGGAMGMLLGIYAIPAMCFALVAAAAAGRRLGTGQRRATMVVAIVLACGVWTIIRTEGMTGEGGAQLKWRWSMTPEQRLLAQAGGLPASASSAPAAALTGAVWPGFRGPNRDSIVRGARIATDWSKSPPVELWRQPIGPAWSSFAVQGDLLYTQEQRGDDELVTCYKVSTGEPVWTHRDAARFWESNAGAGPRGTPTLSNGRIYTFGGTGILNALDAGDGHVIWTRNAATDTGVKTPGWGFASSPLVVDDLVVVAASGALVAYNIDTGEQRWLNKSRGGSYSSPHLLTIDGVPQIVLLSGFGATSVQPADGAQLWENAWPGAPMLQPAVVEGNDILVSTSEMGGTGIRRLTVTRGSGGWTVKEHWTSTGLKPYFNDYVVHKGHAYGFDGFMLSCIDLADGQRKWKGGRYGFGQLVLLPDQDLLLVVTEQGELALVKATPDQFTELARSSAIQGKTWNHPVLAGDVLLVRNGEEMAAFRLSPQGS